MQTDTTQHNLSAHEAKLLADFIHEMNIARRNLSLYPPEHPQIAASITTTLEVLEKLFASRAQVTFGIAPDALLFEHTWLDKSNPTYRQFATFLAGFGVASLSFRRGLNADQLIRFNQLLRADRTTIEEAGGFESLLQQQQIYAISVVPIDYGAFQSSTEKVQQNPAGGTPIWDDFLHGLLDGILDFGEEAGRLDPITVAKILNDRLASGNADNQVFESSAIDQFVGRMVNPDQSESQQIGSGQIVGSLLEHLAPQLQENFLAGTFAALEKNPSAAENFLQKFPKNILQTTLSGQSQHSLKISSRLIELVGRLATGGAPDFEHKIKSDSAPMTKDMVRARLDVLFNEEDQDRYMPGQYQSALHNILQEDLSTVVPHDDKEQLKNALEKQIVERQCCAVIFELLAGPLDPETEDSIQQNLVELSRFFLDTGDYRSLQDIFSSWSEYLYGGLANISILEEKLLANHTQIAFMAEVLDGVELWGEEKQQEIRAYIAVVGEPYADLLIERLGLARTLAERSYWMQVLEGIGGDANQRIIAALTDDRWYLIRNLLIVLGKKLDTHNLKAINQFVNHPHPKVRQEVIRALFRCNPATANRLLLSDLQNPDREAQLAAIQIADLSHDPTVLKLLHQVLQADMHSDSDLEMRGQLLQTLAKAGHRESLTILRSLLRKKGLLQARRQKLFQQEIISALRNFPQDEAKKLLQEIASGHNRQQAKHATEQLQLLRGDAS